MGNRTFLKGTLLFIAGMLLAPFGAAADEIKTVTVLPHIFTVMPKSVSETNASFIVTDQGVVVIDTRGSAEQGLKVLEEIRKKSNKPITHVINTDFHPGSFRGNDAFKDCRSIISHKKTQKAIERWVEQNKIKVTFPNLVYENQVDLTVGGNLLQIKHPGAAHTNGDSYVYLPSWRTIIAGSLVFNEVIPELDDGYVDAWIQALQVIEDLDAEMIVPGDGPPGGKHLVIKAKHYLILLKRYVNQQLDADHTLSQAVIAVSKQLKEKYGEWKHWERVENNIRRAFIEFSTKRGI